MKFYSKTIPCTTYKEKGVEIGSRKFSVFNLKFERNQILNDENKRQFTFESCTKYWLYFSITGKRSFYGIKFSKFK